MKALSILLLLVVAAPSFADSTPGIQAAGSLSRNHEVRGDSRYPVGFWVTRRGNEIQVTRRGYVETNMALSVGFGTPTRLQFDRRLQEVGRDRFRTEGYVPIRYTNGFQQFTCNFPVSMNIKDRGDYLDVEVLYPQSVGIDAFGRCLYWGTQRIVGDFDRD